MAVGTVHHGISGMAYDGGSAITNVVSVQWNQVGAQAVGAIDGSGAASHYVVAPIAVTGSIVFNSAAEAAKLAGKVAASKNLTYNVKSDIDEPKAITIANIKTTAILGSQNSLASAGPYTIQFTADTVSSPAV